MKLYAKLALWVAILAIVTGGVCALLVNVFMHDTLEQELKKRGLVAAQIMAEHVTHSVIDRETVTARQVLYDVVRRTEDVEFAYITDFDGSVLVHSFEQGFPRALLPDEHGHGHGLVSADDPLVQRYTTKQGSGLLIGYPLIDGMKAHLHIGLSEVRMHSQVARTRNQLFGVTLAVALVASLLGIVLSHSIARPLEQLAKSLRAFGEGRVERAPDLVGGGREVADLSRSFNHMIAQRREAEGRLRLLSSAVEQSSEGIAVADLEGKLLFLNQAFAAMHGYTPEELADRHLAIFHTPEQLPSVEAANRQIQETGVFNGEIWHVRRDGSVFPTWMHNSLLRDEAGSPIAMVGTLRDITERKRAEEQLRRLSRLRENLLVPGSLDEKIERITDEIVETFDADFARIWITKAGDRCDSGCIHAEVTEGPHVCRYRDRCLFLRASSGRYTHIDGEIHRRVPFGCYKIGRVAAGEDPSFLTNDVVHDPRVHDHDWARELGLVSFAGYRLVSVVGETIGVLALFSKRAISPDEDALLQGLAGTTSQVIRTAQVEDALRAEKERFQQYLDIAGVAFVVLDSDGCVTLVNRCGSELFGYQEAELIGKNWFDTCLPARLREGVKSVFEQLMAGDVEPVEYYENPILTQTGEEKIVAWHNTLLTDETGRITGTLSSGEDITERKQAEDLMRVQRDLGLALGTAHGFDETLRLCVEAAIRGSGMDSGGVYLVNETSGDIELGFHTGLSSAFVESASHYNPDSAQARLIMGGKPTYVRHQEMNVPLDKVRRREELRAIAIIPVLHGGRVIACLNIASHTSDQVPVFARAALELIATQIGSAIIRSKMEAALRQSQADLQTLFDSVEDFLFVLDVKGCILRVNPIVLQRLGYLEVELLGESVLKVHPPDRREEAAAIVADMVAGKTDVCFVPLMSQDGTLIPVETRVTPGRWGEQNVLFGVSRDITERIRAEEERRKLEAQLQHTQRLESLGVLAGGIAHDFNNLLVSILGNADLALVDLSPASPAHAPVQEIVQSARNAAGLTRQMLAYSGKGRFVVEPLSLNDMVEQIGHLIQVSIPKKVTLSYNLATDLPAIEADASQMQQVIMNLIVNASESIVDESGIVSVYTGTMDCSRRYLHDTFLVEDLAEGTYVYLEVSDTGCGIAMEALPRIFDPFFTTKFVGRGLGLAAVQGIVRGHKGMIKVYSEPGKGSTFKLLFPAIEQALPSSSERSDPSSAAWRGSGTILVVDDEEQVRAVANRMLERRGFSVLQAADGYEALTLFREHADEIVCVLLDLTMPGMGGEECFGELRRLRSDLPILLSSGYNEQEVTQRFVGQGLTGFVPKPYELAEFMEKLREAIER